MKTSIRNLPHRQWGAASALLLSAAMALAQPLTIDFEGLDGMTYFSGNPIPLQSRLSDQFLSTLGVRFSSGSPYVAVVNLGLGHATSGINGIGGATPADILTYDRNFPIVAMFFSPLAPNTPAVTDFVAVRIDQAGGSGFSVTLNAFDVTGSLVGFVTSPDIGGARLEISAPAIHSVQFLGTRDNFGGVALDDFAFNPVTPVPEPSSFVLCAVGLAALWLARRRQVNTKERQMVLSPTRTQKREK
jgi:hypothetical protein